MPLSRFTNTFAGNPLDRAADRRLTPEWIAEQRAHPDALSLALWKGEVLVEPAAGAGERLAYLKLDMAEEATGAEAVFLERPASVHLVVQNTAIRLGPDAIGAVGRRP